MKHLISTGLILLFCLSAMSQEDWPGYEGGNDHTNSSSVDINVSKIGVNWKREFKDPIQLPEFWSFSDLLGNLGSRNICLMDGKIAIVADEYNLGNKTFAQNRKGYISILDADNGMTLNVISGYIPDGPRHLGDYPEIYWDAHDNARGFTVLHWDQESKNLFIMNGGDGNMCTAYKPLDDIASFQSGSSRPGTPAFTHFPRIDREDYEWNRSFPNISSFVECTPNTPTLAHISSTSHNMAVNAWSIQFINKYSGYNASVHFVNEYTPINEPAYVDTAIPTQLRPFSMWGSMLIDENNVYFMGPGDDTDTTGALGDMSLIGSLSGRRNPDQGLYIWSYSIDWASQQDDGYGDATYELDSVSLDTNFCYRFPSLHIPVDGYKDAESHLELDGFYRNKSWLIDNGAVWATWKADKATNAQLIYCDKDSSVTYNLNVNAGMRGQDTWPHISLAEVAGNKYIVYYGANAYINEYTDSYNTWGGVEHYDEQTVGSAEIAVFDVLSKSVKWTYNLSDNETSLKPNLSMFYFDESLLVVSGKYAIIGWVDVTGIDAKLQLLSFDITVGSATPIHQSINLGFLSAENRRSKLTDLAAANGNLYALVTQSDTLHPLNQTFKAQHLYSLSATPDITKPITSGVFENTSTSPDYAILSWDDAIDNNWVVSYNIYLNGDLIENTKENTLITLLTPGQTHTYTLEAVDAAGNISDQDTLIIGPDGQTVNVTQSNINNVCVFPNPASKTIRIQSDNSINEYNILSLSGTKVLSQDHLMLKEIDINIENLKTGVYFVQIIGVDYCCSKTIIKK